SGGCGESVLAAKATPTAALTSCLAGLAHLCRADASRAAATELAASLRSSLLQLLARTCLEAAPAEWAPLRASCRALLAQILPSAPERLRVQDEAQLTAVASWLDGGRLSAAELRRCLQLCTHICWERPEHLSALLGAGRGRGGGTAVGADDGGGCGTAIVFPRFARLFWDIFLRESLSEPHLRAVVRDLLRFASYEMWAASGGKHGLAAAKAAATAVGTPATSETAAAAAAALAATAAPVAACRARLDQACLRRTLAQLMPLLRLPAARVVRVVADELATLLTPEEAVELPAVAIPATAVAAATAASAPPPDVMQLEGGSAEVAPAAASSDPAAGSAELDVVTAAAAAGATSGTPGSGGGSPSGGDAAGAAVTAAAATGAAAAAPARTATAATAADGAGQLQLPAADKIEYRCDGCDTFPLRGAFYHCTECDDFDICRRCRPLLDADGSNVVARLALDMGHRVDHAMVEVPAHSDDGGGGVGAADDAGGAVSSGGAAEDAGGVAAVVAEPSPTGGLWLMGVEEEGEDCSDVGAAEGARARSDAAAAAGAAANADGGGAGADAFRPGYDADVAAAFAMEECDYEGDAGSHSSEGEDRTDGDNGPGDDDGEYGDGNDADSDAGGDGGSGGGGGGGGDGGGGGSGAVHGDCGVASGDSDLMEVAVDAGGRHGGAITRGKKGGRRGSDGEEGDDDDGDLDSVSSYEYRRECRSGSVAAAVLLPPSTMSIATPSPGRDPAARREWEGGAAAVAQAAHAAATSSVSSAVTLVRSAQDEALAKLSDGLFPLLLEKLPELLCPRSDRPAAVAAAGAASAHAATTAAARANCALHFIKLLVVMATRPGNTTSAAVAVTEAGAVAPAAAGSKSAAAVGAAVPWPKRAAARLRPLTRVLLAELRHLALALGCGAVPGRGDLWMRQAETDGLVIVLQTLQFLLTWAVDTTARTGGVLGVPRTVKAARKSGSGGTASGAGGRRGFGSGASAVTGAESASSKAAAGAEPPPVRCGAFVKLVMDELMPAAARNSSSNGGSGTGSSRQRGTASRGSDREPRIVDVTGDGAAAAAAIAAAATAASGKEPPKSKIAASRAAAPESPPPPTLPEILTHLLRESLRITAAEGDQAEAAALASPALLHVECDDAEEEDPAAAAAAAVAAASAASAGGDGDAKASALDSAKDLVGALLWRSVAAPFEAPSLMPSAAAAAPAPAASAPAAARAASGSQAAMA
ncbi:unnamed protein product, partial [Phaeothamnion confervicola]